MLFLMKENNMQGIESLGSLRSEIEQLGDFSMQIGRFEKNEGMEVILQNSSWRDNRVKFDTNFNSAIEYFSLGFGHSIKHGFLTLATLGASAAFVGALYNLTNSIYSQNIDYSNVLSIALVPSLPFCFIRLINHSKKVVRKTIEDKLACSDSIKEANHHYGNLKKMADSVLAE